MNDAPRPLDETEARVVEAVWRGVDGALPGRRLQGVGCLVAFVGMAALTVTPALANYVEVDPASAYALLGVSVVLLALGATLGLLGAGRDEGARPEALDAAVERLRSAQAASDADALAEATAVLVRLRDAGPGVDVAGVARRLGPSARVVRRVEAHLVARGLLPPAAR